MAAVHIISTDNARVKHVFALQSDKRERERERLAVVENPVMLKEALKSGICVKEVYFTEKMYAENADLAAECESAHVEVFTVSERVMAKMSDQNTPQGVCAVFGTDSLPSLEISENGRYIVCERMADPGNLGTVIRTADAFSFDGVITTSGSVDVFSPKVIRATMGGIFRVPVLAGAPLKDIMDKLNANGVTTVAAVLDEKAVPADALSISGGAAVLIGNEAAGLSREAVEMCEKCAYIPMSGRAESLNASVAASVFMWLLRR